MASPKAMDAKTGERGEFAGRDRLIQRSGAGLDAVVACWQDDLMWFRRTRTRFLLY